MSVDLNRATDDPFGDLVNSLRLRVSAVHLLRLTALQFSFFFNLRRQHHRRGAGDTAIFADAPEVHHHEDGRNSWNGDAMPDVGA